MRAGTDVVRLHLLVVEEVVSSFTSVTAAYCRVDIFLLFSELCLSKVLSVYLVNQIIFY